MQRQSSGGIVCSESSALSWLGRELGSRWPHSQSQASAVHMSTGWTLTRSSERETHRLLENSWEVTHRWCCWMFSTNCTWGYFLCLLERLTATLRRYASFQVIQRNTISSFHIFICQRFNAFMCCCYSFLEFHKKTHIQTIKTMNLFCFHYGSVRKRKCFCVLHSPFQDNMNRREVCSPSNAPLIPFAVPEIRLNSLWSPRCNTAFTF